MTHFFTDGGHDTGQTSPATSAAERLELALDVASLAVWDWDIPAGEVTFDERVVALLGHDDDYEMTLEEWIDRTHPDDLSTVQAEIDHHFKEQTDRSTSEYRVQHNSGDWIWIRTVGKVIERDEDGEPRRAIGIHQDITDRKERERQLTFFKELVETVGVCIAVYDRHGEFVYVNEAYAELLETTRSTLEGTKLWEINPAIERDRFSEYWESFSPGETRTAETTHACGETEVPVETITTSHEIQETTYHFGTIRDLTARRAYERELERRNDRLEEFASVVSHDLRNPLNVAQGKVELAKAECDSDHLAAIERAHGRMETLIEDLLTLARQGETVTDTEPISLASFIQECWRNVETHDATLTIDIDGTITADRNRLKQLFENLIRNAIEHGGEGVNITVGELADGLYIEDDGSGIPDDQQDEVFEAGYTTDPEGTGFGLSIVKQIVDAHGWEIRVTDGSAGGAQFKITGPEMVD